MDTVLSRPTDLFIQLVTNDSIPVTEKTHPKPVLYIGGANTDLPALAKLASWPYREYGRNWCSVSAQWENATFVLTEHGIGLSEDIKSTDVKRFDSHYIFFFRNIIQTLESDRSTGSVCKGGTA
jgi:hypothetical protein